MTSLSRAVNLHLSRSDSNQRAIEQSESTKSIKIRVLQSEPLNTASFLIEVYKTVELVFHVRGHNLTFPDRVPEHGGGDDACHLLQPPPR